MRKALLHSGLFWLLTAIGMTWFCLAAQRLGFAAAFVPGFPRQPPPGLWSQFILGLRFDIATLPVLVAPLLVIWPALSYFMEFSRGIRVALRSAIFLLFPLFVWGQLSVLAGSIYFAFNQKLPGWEYYAYINDLPLLVRGVFGRQPLLATAAVAAAVGVPVVGFLLIFGRWSLLPDPLRTRPSGNSGKNRPSAGKALRMAAATLFSLGLAVVALRGGWQQSPLRAADALRTGDAALDALPLNTVYTALQDFSDRTEFRRFYERDHNIRFVQTLIGDPADFTRPDYPLVRRMPARRPFALDRPNVVLVIMESFSAALLGPYGGDPALTPEFNRLSRRGLLFRRFFAAGGRSANGIFCMLAGIPDRAGRTILRSPQISIRLGGIGRLLRRKGYDTFFHHGGDLAFDNLDRVLPHLGFARPVGLKEMAASGCCRMKNVWGYDDSETMGVFLQRMEHARDPFFGVVFTLNTHHPFAVPPEFPRKFSGRPQADFLNALHYSDHVLGRFLAEASRRPFFANTVFLITGDHPHHTGLDYLDDRMVPLLIYMPGRIPAGLRDDVASQLDLLPTILALSGGNSEYASMGRDLTRPGGRDPFAFFAGGSGTNVIGWIQGDRIFSEWLVGSVRGMYTSRRPLTMRNLLNSEPDRAAQLRMRTLHFHQFARTIERENRVWPDRN